MATYVTTSISGLYQYVNGMHGGPRATSGDTILVSGTVLNYLPDATYANAVPLNPQPGVHIQKYPNSTPYISARGTLNTLQIEGDGTATYLNDPIIISGVNFLAYQASGTMPIGDYGWYSFKQCNVKIYDSEFSGKSTAQSKNCFTAEAASGKPCYVELYRVTVYQAGADCLASKIDIGGSAPDAQQSYIKAYDCYLYGAGQKHDGSLPASNDQIFTSHEGMPIYIFGGKIGNGITCAGADGYHYMYFTDCDPITPIPLVSGQTNTKDLKDLYVTFGNVINMDGTITSNTIDGTTGGRTYNASIGQTKMRDYGLVRSNYIIYNGRASNQNLFENSTVGYSGGNYAFIANMISQSGTFPGDNFLIRQHRGYTSITGIVHSNILIGLGQSANGTQFVRIPDTYVASGVTFTNLVYNNASIGGKAFLAYNNGTIPSGQGSITYASNNFMTINYPFDNTSVDHSFGYIRFSGNLWNAAQPNNFNAPLFTQVGDTFSATAGVSGSRFNYYPTPGGNLDFGNGVGINLPHANDGVGETNIRGDYRGAKSRQQYDGELFPTFVM